MEDHVPRHAQMGAWVLINDRWYKAGPLGEFIARFENDFAFLHAEKCRLSKRLEWEFDCNCESDPISLDTELA